MERLFHLTTEIDTTWSFLGRSCCGCCIHFDPSYKFANNEPDSESDLAASFIESTSTTRSVQSTVQELESESAISDSEVDSGTTTEAPQAPKRLQAPKLLRRTSLNLRQLVLGVVSAEVEDQTSDEEWKK